MNLRTANRRRRGHRAKRIRGYLNHVARIVAAHMAATLGTPNHPWFRFTHHGR